MGLCAAHLTSILYSSQNTLLLQSEREESAQKLYLITNI